MSSRSTRDMYIKDQFFFSTWVSCTYHKKGSVTYTVQTLIQCANFFQLVWRS